MGMQLFGDILRRSLTFHASVWGCAGKAVSFYSFRQVRSLGYRAQGHLHLQTGFYHLENVCNFEL